MSYGMFRLPLWSSVVGGNNKVTAEDVKVLAAPQRTAPSMESAPSHNLKRKRSDSGEFEKAISSKSGYRNMEAPNPHSLSPAGNGHVSVKTHDHASLSASTSAAPSTQATSPERTSNPALSTSKDHDRSLPPNSEKSKEPILQPKAARKMVEPKALRETVEAQISLEILLKHDELRLIDQEIAKCQVALEQLRRCHEIPYPVSNQTEPSLSVSGGTGFSITPRDGSEAPLSPAPWGVSDGPYSRHYSTWLLPDSRFDGGEPEMVPQPAAGAGKTVAEGRTTRASWNEMGGAASRPQRGSKGAKLQELPNGNPTPKDKATPSPVIIKRKSDGLYVKLVCIDCRRVNFSSTQGFINHCRIAHNRLFATHEAAAQASGEPVEVDETGAVIGNGDESSSSGPPGHVHPLVRTAHVVGSNVKSNPRKISGSGLSPGPNPKPETTDKSATKQPPTPNNIPLRRPDVAETNSSFKASLQTPHLSALMQRKGLGLDLHNIVDDALSKTDMDIYSSGEESEDEAEPDPKNISPLDARGSRLPARTVASSSTQRPGSQKGADKGGRKPRSSAPSKPLSTPGRLLVSLPLPQASPESAQQTQTRDHDSDTNLSPHTIKSNQAPSLVSDDGECGARTSESPSPSSSGLSEDETMFGNIEVQDDGNESTTTGSAADVGVTHTPGKHRPATMSRTASTSKSGKAKSSGKKMTASPAAKNGNTKKQRRK